MRRAVLLDTNAAIWLVQQARMAPPAMEAIDGCATKDGVLISPVSAWEIGVLARKRRLLLNGSPDVWFTALLALPGIRLTPLTAMAAINASLLPGDFHDDPADRLLVATARELDIPLITRDRKILDYAEMGFVDAVRC